MIHPLYRLFDRLIHLFMFVLLMVPLSRFMVVALLVLHRLLFLMLLMFLDLPCSLFPVVRLLTLTVGSFSTLTLVLFSTVALVLYLVQVPVAVTLRVFGSLTGFIFLPLLPLPVPPPLLPYLPALFSSGITDLVTSVALVSPLLFAVVFWDPSPVVSL